MGMLDVAIYKNPDFTQLLKRKTINWVSLGMNSTFDECFDSKLLQYSMKITGILTTVTSNTYQLFIVSNKNADLYINRKKIIAKSFDDESSRYILNLFSDQLYDFEIRISVSEKIADPHKPFIKARWESQSLANMDIKPRNFFMVNPIETSGEATVVVFAAEANPMNSTVIDTTSGVTGSEYDETRRLDYKIIPLTQTITGYVIIKDYYGNVRGENEEAEDNVKVRLFKEWNLEETLTLTRDASTFMYDYSFTPAQAGYYQVDILLDDLALDINTFTRDLKYKVV